MDMTHLVLCALVSFTFTFVSSEAFCHRDQCLHAAAVDGVEETQQGVHLLQRALWHHRKFDHPVNQSKNQTGSEASTPPRLVRSMGTVHHYVGNLVPTWVDLVVDQIYSFGHWLVYHQIEGTTSDNSFAFWVCIAWAASAGAVILRSMILVAKDPQQQDKNAEKCHEVFQDEDAAWSRGCLWWVNFCWTDSFMSLIRKCSDGSLSNPALSTQRVQLDHVPHMRIRRAWDKQIQKSGGMEKASLAEALYEVVGFKGCLSILFGVAIEQACGTLGMAFALEGLLRDLEVMHARWREHPGVQVELLHPIVMAILMVFVMPIAFRVVSIIVNLCDGYYTNLCIAGLSSLIYEKALQLPAGDVEHSDVEKAGIDTNRCGEDAAPDAVQRLSAEFAEMCAHLLKMLASVIVAPIASCLLIWRLVLHLQLAGIAGALYLVPAAGIMCVLQSLVVRQRKAYQECQDQRLDRTCKVMLHIRTIKALAWETFAFEQLSTVRQKELSAGVTCTIGLGSTQANLHTMAPFAMLISLLLAILMFEKAGPVDIILSQWILALLLSEMQLLGAGVQKCITAPMTLNRIKAFLQLPERPKNAVRPTPLDTTAPAARLVGSFSYQRGGKLVLSDLDFAIPRGSLVAVVGAAGSGKTALLQALLGDLFACGQRSLVEAPRGLAYCAQEPWVFDGSLRENIVLSQSFEQERYWQAARVAGLLTDLETLPGGDQAPVGPSGVNLSANLRARLALARAAYMERADLVLLDDPFECLGTATSQHFLRELQHGPCWQGRTRVVALRPGAVSLQSFDRIVVISGGRIAASGSPAEVAESEAYQHLVEVSNRCDVFLGDALPRAEIQKKVSSQGAPQISRGGQSSARTRCSWATFRWWLQAGGWCNILLFVVVVLTGRLVQIWEALLLARWVNAKVERPIVDFDFQGLLLLATLVSSVTIVLLFWVGARTSSSASTNIHTQVLRRFLRARMDRFYDKQPIGRMMSQLSFDIHQVDDTLALCAIKMAAFFTGMLMTQAYIFSVLRWWLLAAALPIGFALAFFVHVYRCVAVPLLIYSKSSLSTLHEMQGTVLSSAVSIRANGMTPDFTAKHNIYAASIIRRNYLIFHVTKAWLQLRITLCLCTIATASVIGGIWYSLPMGTIANIICLSFALMLEFESISMMFPQLVTALGALQRLAYCTEVPQEAPAELPEDPKIRISLTIQREELVILTMRNSPDGMLTLFTPGELPVLQTSDHGRSLELVDGRRFCHLAPGSEVLRNIADGYHIVSVNNVHGSAQKMAAELITPPTTVCIDLWKDSSKGGLGIQLQDLCVGYGVPSLLRGINMEVAPRTKAALTGPPGVGKSTLLYSMLRLLEPRGGRVVIGGVDVSTLGLQALRSMVGFVPSEPFVFEGTWRQNLDPFGFFPDQRLWDALSRTHLLHLVRALHSGLDSNVSRDNAGLNPGQLRLVSFARMAAQQPPVLLVDGCSTLLGAQEDKAARDCVLNGFPMSTVLAVVCNEIALHDYDQVICLADGGIAEADHAAAKN